MNGSNDTIEVNGVKYIRQDGDSDIRIVILHRGFVYVGRFEQDGPNCILRNAFNIRRWGTSSGLGELAEKGPLANTKLDKCGVVRFHELGIVAQIDCGNEVWNDVLR